MLHPSTVTVPTWLITRTTRLMTLSNYLLRLLLNQLHNTHTFGLHKKFSKIFTHP